MILPTKHLTLSRSMLYVGAVIIEETDRASTVTALWDRCRRRPEVGTFDRFVLGLDLLFMLGIVTYEDGMLRRKS